MPEKQQWLSQLLDELNHSQSLNEAFDTYQNTVMKMGYAGVLYGFAPALFKTDKVFHTPAYKTAGLYTEEFIHHYFQEQLYLNDYTLQAVMAGKMKTINWWEAVRLNQLHPPQINVLNVAKKFGLHNGLTFPLMNNTSGLAGISVASHEDQDSFMQLNTVYQRDLLYCSQIFNGHVWAKHRVDMYQQFCEPVLKKFTEAEREILRVIAHINQLKDLAKLLDKSPRRCEILLSSIRTKLGGISTYQLMYYAGALNFQKIV